MLRTSIKTTRLGAGNKSSRCLGFFCTILFHEAPKTIYLGWHHFCIGSSNFHTSIKARSVVSLHNVSAIGFVCPYTAVVRTCNGTGEQQGEHEFPEGKRLKLSEDRAHTGKNSLGMCRKAPKSVFNGSTSRAEHWWRVSPSESLDLGSVFTEFEFVSHLQTNKPSSKSGCGQSPSQPFCNNFNLMG